MALRYLSHAVAILQRATADGLHLEDPTDFNAEQALGFASGRSVVFVIAPPDQLEEAIDNYYAPEKAVQTFLDKLGATDADDISVVETEDDDDVSAAEADSAPVVQLTNLIPHITPEIHINTCCWFIKKKNARLV